MKSKSLIPTRIVPSVSPSDQNPRQIAAEFKRLLDDGVKFSTAGKEKNLHAFLSDHGLKPKFKIELFDTRFYLTNIRQIPELRFFVAWLLQTVNEKPTLFPRIIYKDLSLAWRSASHFTVIDDHIWVGKGDVRIDDEDGFETIESIESTTDLPLEMQTATESLLSRSKRTGKGQGVLELILRKGPGDRVAPYADFVKPRERAQQNPANLIHRGKRVARFKRPGDPQSLYIIDGYEPDFENGIIERAHSFSKLYGGKLARYRIMSTNRKIQFYFLSGKHHVWIYPPQATTTELSTYGVRTIDVEIDDDLAIPGYEYHHIEQTAEGEELYSQIPTGYAGQVCPKDDAKADASPWLDELKLIRDFRSKVLKGK